MIPTSRFLRPLQRAASGGRVRSLLKLFDESYGGGGKGVRADPERRRRAIGGLVTALAKGELTPEAEGDAGEGLLSRWERLSEAERSRVKGLPGARIKRGLWRAARAESAAVRRVAAGLAGEWPIAEAVRAAGRLATDRVGAVRSAAEGALESAAEVQASGELDAGACAALDEALADLAGRYPEHRMRGVLRAAASVADVAGPRLREWMASGPDAEMMPLRSAVREGVGAGEGARARAVRLLGIPALASSAAEVLGSPATAAGHEAALRSSGLLHARGRARALSRLEDPLGALPEQGALEGLSVEARVGASRWAALSPSPAGRRAAALGQMLRDPEGAVRLAAVWRLGALAASGCVGACGLLEDAAYDAEPAVALAALRELERVDASRGGGAARRHAGWLLRSPSPAVRSAARALAGEGDGWSLIVRGEARGWSALRAEHEASPLVVAAALRGRIASGPSAERALAARAARRLGIAREVEAELLAAASGDDERAAAAAVTALGEVDTAAARAAVSSLLAHADARVRANAVEAIARRNPDEPVVRSWVEHEVPRARGNAVRARVVLAGAADGAPALAKMLGDERRPHRLSGLWVAERVGAVEVSERVAELARDEAEPRVRERARRCARRLLAEMRLREAGPAGRSDVEAAG